MDKIFICLYAVKIFNSQTKEIAKDFGLIAADSYTEAMEKISELYGKNLINIKLTLHNNKEAICINKETYNQLEKYMEVKNEV